MLKAQSPISDHQIQRPKSGRKPLQPKNSPATPIIPHQKPKPTKQNAATDRIEIATIDDNSNKENLNPLFATSVKTESFKIQQLGSSLAEELSAIREKLERLRTDKEKTEKMLSERDLALDLQMNELHKRGEAQKMLEIEVDRLYRLKQLKLSCTDFPDPKAERRKKIDKGMKTSYRDEFDELESEAETDQTLLEPDVNCELLAN